MPRVSVIIPVYNAEKYIEKAIYSILNQTYDDFEIILVNDCSTDSSVEKVKIIADSRIKLYNNEVNHGIAYTRNRALSLASGEYIALFDDDDLMPINRLELEVNYLDEHTAIDLVGGHMRYIDEQGRPISKYTKPFFNPNYIKAHIMLENTFANGTVMLRHEFVKKHHIRWEDAMYGAEDYRFFVECSLCGKLANMNEILLYWRTGHNQETIRMRTSGVNERTEAISQIHNYALKENGFIFSETELKILNEVFKEEGIVKNETILKELYDILRKLSEQAEEMHLDNAKEIKEMCRKRFGEKVGKAFFLWE